MSVDTEQQPRPKQRHIDFRRNQVFELINQGRTEREIAQILKVGNGTVHRDIAYLNKRAQDSLKEHVSQKLPVQFTKSLNGLDQVLKMAWNIVIIDSINQQTKLQALSLISDCYKYQMDLTSGSAIITDAIKYVNGKMDHLNKEEKEILQDINNKKKKKEEAEAEAEDINEELDTEQQTHNTVF